MLKLLLVLMSSVMQLRRQIADVWHYRCTVAASVAKAMC